MTDASYNQQVQASNNVVTIYDVIAQANSSSNNNSKYSLDKFEEALKAADLKKTLSDKNRQFTVFAPSDDAFVSLGKGSLEKLLKKKKKLRSIMSYHIIPNAIIDFKDFKNSESPSAFMWPFEGNQPVKINIHTKSIEVKDAKIIEQDLKTSNGVIHVIDKVVFPSGVRL